jgi:hypothetical protein
VAIIQFNQILSRACPQRRLIHRYSCGPVQIGEPAEKSVGQSTSQTRR